MNLERIAVKQRVKQRVKQQVKQRVKQQVKTHVTRLQKAMSDPWFTLLMMGVKTVDVVGGHIDAPPGTVLLYTNDEMSYKRRVRMTVVDSRPYDTMMALLHEERLKNVLPGVGTKKHGVQVLAGATGIGLNQRCTAIKLTRGELLCKV
jgi:ASC-1-like (ASCH) protein